MFSFRGGGELCAGKQVELGRGGVDRSYSKYLQLNPEL